MNKPLYKYVSIWGILGGTALAYIYLKTLGKNKNLSLNNSLLIGSAVGFGLGLGIDLAVNSNEKPITEQELTDYAKSISPEAESELNSYISSIKNVNSSELYNQKILRVLKAFLSAKKDNKWDTKGDIDVKSKVLISYGVSRSDVNYFESTLKDNLFKVASNYKEKLITT